MTPLAHQRRSLNKHANFGGKNDVTMDVTRRTLLVGGAALTLVGCGDDGASGGLTPTPTPAASPTPSPSPSPSPTPTAAPTATWACVGDSMIHGVVGTADSIPTRLTQLTGISFDDLGVIAQTSTEIAARIGATDTILSVEGDMIPASGPVALTALTPKIVNHTGPDTVIDSQAVQLAIPGTLNGVHGTLRRDQEGGRVNADVPIGAFHFVRFDSGAAVACPPGTPFVPDNRTLYRRSPLMLRMGYNNRADFDQVREDHLAVFAWNEVVRTRILLLDPPISFYDDAAAIAQSNRIAAFLREQATARGMLFHPIHDYVASREGLADAGVTPTADDLAAIADRRTPMSATTGDGLHYNAAMNRAIAARLAAVLRDAGAI